MSAEYNSKLISKLYNNSSDGEELEILNEMGEIGDPVFVYPIFDHYKKYSSNYCLYILSQIDSPDVLNIAEELINGIRNCQRSFSDIIRIFDKHRHYTDQAIELSRSFINDLLDKEARKRWNDPDERDLSDVLGYLLNAKALDRSIDPLKSMYFTSICSKGEKAIALSFVLKINPSELIDFFIQAYDSIRNTDEEIILAKELLTWKGGKVSMLKGLIIDKGQPRAQEILLESERKKGESDEKEKKQTAEKESIVFNNAGVVATITKLRKSINTLSLAIPAIAVKLLSDSELLVSQIEVPTDESGLKGLCSNLRTIFQAIDKKVGEHGFTEEQMKVLIPNLDASAINLSIDQLFFYLKSKGIDIDTEVFGLRKIHRIMSLFAHPAAEGEMVKRLKQEEMLDMYTKKDWAGIHKRFLELYQSFLEKLESNLIANSNK